MDTTLDRRKWSITTAQALWRVFCFCFCFFNSFFFSLIFISWRLITLQYCSGFCHTLTWISHGFSCIPHPNRFERTASKRVLSRVKQITSPGWMHETSARAWCTGKTQRDRIEREVGGGIGMKGILTTHENS